MFQDGSGEKGKKIWVFYHSLHYKNQKTLHITKKKQLCLVFFNKKYSQSSTNHYRALCCLRFQHTNFLNFSHSAPEFFSIFAHATISLSVSRNWMALEANLSPSLTCTLKQADYCKYNPRQGTTSTWISQHHLLISHKVST